jgi:hypothetical protein
MKASIKVLGYALASIITFSMVGTGEAIDTVPLPERPRYGSVAIDTVPMPGKIVSRGKFGKNRFLRPKRSAGDPRVMGTTLPVPDRKFRTPFKRGFRTPNTLPAYKVGRQFYKVAR